MKLLDAAINGDLEAVKRIVDSNLEDINMKNQNGSTPLILAASSSHLDVVSYLITKGANIELVNSFGDSALTAAIMNFEVSKKIIDAGYNQYNSATTNTALNLMADDRNIKLIKHAALAGWDINQPNILNETIIFSAIKNITFLKQLLNANLELNLDYMAYRTPPLHEYDRTPLSIAATMKTTQAAKILIESGADINATFGDKLNTVMLSINSTDSFIELVLDNYKEKFNSIQIDLEGFTALHYAVFNKNVRLTERLIFEDLDINHQSSKLVTPLMIAARKGDMPMIECLIKHNATIDMTDAKGDSAIDVARYNKFEDISIFLEKEALSQMVDNDDDEHNFGL